MFLEADSLPPDEQRTFVEREFANEPELRDRVLSMLGTDVGVDSFVSFATARPERIGPYEIVEEIGRGGMGAVFRALQPTTKRVVALKLLRTELLGEALVRRFTLEVEVLGQLQHPNIAQIYEGGNARLTSGTVPYFVMEFVPHAKPIDRFVLDQGLDAQATLRLFLQLCSAIEYAHHKGIIHRDLKPENVLVDAEAKEPLPKVIDFGIARVSDAGTPGTAMTTTGQIIGTFESMSPEQARGATDEIDIRTDVYALGVVLYKMLTGGPPIPTRSLPIGDAIQAILEQPPAPPSKRRTGIRAELDAILLMCLAKERDLRYETVRALHEDVEAFLEGRTVKAKAPTTMDVLRMTVRRYRAVLIPASIVFVVALVAAIVSIRFGLLANEREAETRAQAAELARNAYQSNLGAAAAAIEAAETELARRYLDSAPEELRGWEWNYLSSRTSREVAAFETRAPYGYRLAFDPSGERFLTTSAPDSAVCIWSASSGELLQMVTVGAVPTWAEFDGPNAIFARHGTTGAVQIHRIPLDGTRANTWASDAVRSNGWNGAAATGGYLLEYVGTDSLALYDLHTRKVVHTLPRRCERTWPQFAPVPGWVIMEGENPDGTWTVDVFDPPGKTPVHTIQNIDVVLRQAEVGPSGPVFSPWVAPTAASVSGIWKGALIRFTRSRSRKRPTCSRSRTTAKCWPASRRMESSTGGTWNRESTAASWAASR